ncbi:MAG: septum formation initiator family protein [Alkalispirochaeta sp.]
MKLWSLVIATLVGVATYLLLELFFGSYGFVAYDLMNDYVALSNQELEELEERHAALRDQIRRLTTSRETIRLEARDSGLVAPDEYIVRIEGREPRPRHRYSPGSLPPVIPETRDNRPLFRSIGVAVALVYILVDALAFHPNPTALHRRRRTTGSSWDVEVEGEEFQT